MICVLLLLIFTMRSIDAEVIEIDDRSVFSYEINDIQMTDRGINIEGWGMLLNAHNFYGSQTHSYTIELISENDRVLISSQTKPISLTSFMAYRGYPNCGSHVQDASLCNYEFNNVGFTTLIPYDKLIPNESYTVYLILNSKVKHQSFKTPLFYPSDQTLQRKVNHLNFKVKPSQSHVKLNVFYHTLVVPNGPAHSSQVGILNQRKRCSVTYGGLSYFKQGATFKQIRKIHKYNNLITYFEVGLNDGTCDGLRWRFSEGNVKVGFLPSNFVNYSGMPLIIDVIAQKPKIIANDRIIDQYDEFDPFKGVVGYNNLGVNITNQLKMNHKVNSRVPGKYPLCISFEEQKKCVTITVREIETTFRYIHPQMFELDQLKLWSTHESFKSYIERIMQKST